MQTPPYARSLPVTQAPPARHVTPAAEFLVQHLPGDARLQDKFDTCQGGAVRAAEWSSTPGFRRLRWQEGRDDFPQGVADQWRTHAANLPHGEGCVRRTSCEVALQPAVLESASQRPQPSTAVCSSAFVCALLWHFSLHERGIQFVSVRLRLSALGSTVGSSHCNRALYFYVNSVREADPGCSMSLLCCPLSASSTARGRPFWPISLQRSILRGSTVRSAGAWRRLTAYLTL
jgi:hypothetical protein